MGLKPQVQGVRSPHNSPRRENRSHGEGGDRDAYHAKETDSGHAGSGKSLQTSLREISKKAGRDKKYRFGNLYTMLTKDVLIEAMGMLNPKAAGVGGILKPCIASFWGCFSPSSKVPHYTLADIA